MMYILSIYRKGKLTKNAVQVNVVLIVNVAATIITAESSLNQSITKNNNENQEEKAKH
jgi:hypothetical protein